MVEIIVKRVAKIISEFLLNEDFYVILLPGKNREKFSKWIISLPSSHTLLDGEWSQFYFKSD